MRLFWNSEIRKISRPKARGSRCPVVCNECPRLLVRRFCISGVGVYCLFLLQGSFRNLRVENKQKIRLHAFFVSVPNLFYC